MIKKYIVLLLITFSCGITAYAQKVIPLYDGKAPGSENWNWKEENLGGYLRDVTDPSLTVFAPANPNGIAVIIAPGGAFHFLAWDIEGTSLAKRLNEKGITAFVLKYRLVHEDPAHPYVMKMLQSGNSKLMDSVSAPVVKLATQDGIQAVKYVREHAAEYQIDPNKIGIEGSSAGGTIAMSVAYSSEGVSRPNFVAPIYGYAGLIIGSKVPTEPMPIFICAASNDNMVPISNSVGFYTKWLDAGQQAELHIYQKGGHGFGTKTQNLPVDTWTDRFCDWLLSNYGSKK